MYTGVLKMLLVKQHCMGRTLPPACILSWSAASSFMTTWSYRSPLHSINSGKKGSQGLKIAKITKSHTEKNPLLIIHKHHVDNTHGNLLDSPTVWLEILDMLCCNIIG